MYEYKHFTDEAKRGIKGEAFFETLITDYALPHHIVGSKDLGVDYICEWVHGDNPTGILFAVQVKTSLEEKVKVTHKRKNTNRNFLEEYSITGRDDLLPKDKTQIYWKRLGIPVYIFAIIQINDHLDCYYKRFTPVITTDKHDPKDLPFYKVNSGSKFLAFAPEKEKPSGGFARDLFIDYIRWIYYKGSIAYPNPRSLGLEDYGEENIVFGELLDEYKSQVCDIYKKTKNFMEKYCL